MATIKSELDRLGENIIRDAKKYALPNKKTGTLDRSLNYKASVLSKDKFTLVLNEIYYGKYLNNKTEYMDKAVRNNLDKGIDSIIDVQIDEILKELNN